ncbi:hypothetical protein KFK09_028445 [Dendrobium nobile]|uniref:Uncharacterized protein n=1 Tax=Dendrobium nobile TaxID=94219 RepID=A0A8T3A2M7_DENNO|nr:hypothetical protein KFK09_028445 [Dendrobium nobile]
MEEIPTSNKREREDYDELLSSQEEKRLRSDLILDIFDDDTDAGSEDGLASVMKSLEEEIGLPSPIDPPPSEVPFDSGDAQQPDLGYLLEASDDELGLPPTVASSEEDGGLEVRDCAEVDAGFGQIWGFADELPECYDGFEYSAFRPDESDSVAGEDVGVLGGDLFSYADEFYPPTDLSDLSWRSESLPAV